jgi:hypothetical protein
MVVFRIAMEPERGIINHSLSISFQLYICLPCVHILVRYMKIVFQKDSQHIYFIPAHVASKTIKQRELLRLIDDVSCGGEWSYVVANLWGVGRCLLADFDPHCGSAYYCYDGKTDWHSLNCKLEVILCVFIGQNTVLKNYSLILTKLLSGKV